MSWYLPREQRDSVIKRVSNGIGNLAFTESKTLDSPSEDLAERFEGEAHAFAEAAASTETGERPHSEGVRAYAKKLAELITAEIRGEKPGATNEQAKSASTSVLDLYNTAREFIDGEMAEELLASLLAEGASHRSIRLSTKSFGKEAAQVACRAIENVAETLTDLDISDTIAGRPEEEALAALELMCTPLRAGKLKRINLSDNALGEKGMRACAPAFRGQSALELVSLENVGCSRQACEAFVELFDRPESMRSLRMYNNMSGSEGAEAISRLLSYAPGLEDFKMASSRVMREGGVALASSLATGSSLRHVDLSDNGLMESTAHELANTLSLHSNLTELRLNECGLSDGGVSAIAEALKEAAPGLEILELAANDVGPKAAEALRACLASKRCLRVLKLSENELGDEGVGEIIEGLKKAECELKSMDVYQNELTAQGALEIARFVSELDLHEGEFEKLNLNGNQISSDGVSEVVELLTQSGRDHALGSFSENDSEDDEV